MRYFYYVFYFTQIPNSPFGFGSCGIDTTTSLKSSEQVTDLADKIRDKLNLEGYVCKSVVIVNFILLREEQI